jgi:hypothetical protein
VNFVNFTLLRDLFLEVSMIPGIPDRDLMRTGEVKEVQDMSNFTARYSHAFL